MQQMNHALKGFWILRTRPSLSSWCLCSLRLVKILMWLPAKRGACSLLHRLRAPPWGADVCWPLVWTWRAPSRTLLPTTIGSTIVCVSWCPKEKLKTNCGIKSNYWAKEDDTTLTAWHNVDSMIYCLAWLRVWCISDNGKLLNIRMHYGCMIL